VRETELGKEPERLRPATLFRSAPPFIHGLVLTVERLMNHFVGQPRTKGGLHPCRQTSPLNSMVAGCLPQVRFADWSSR
jgi:hypothetical protein